MFERKSEESERERIKKEKNSIKRHAPENERVSYVPISFHAETKQKG